MKRFLFAILVLLAAAFVCRGDVHTGFQPPQVTGSPAGTILSGQDAWYLPPGSVDYRAYTYTGNAFGFASNPQGATQFIAGQGPGGAGAARAERTENFGGADVWTISVDVATRFLGAAPGTNNIGSFSLQDSTLARSFTGLLSWTNPNAPGTWQLGYLVYDAAGVQVAQPGLFAGPQWQGLLQNHWYRVSTTFSLSLNRVLTVSIRDLSTLVTTTAHPTNWYLTGGTTPVLPPPNAFRLFAGGTVLGNTVGWDNLDMCPFQVVSFNPPVGQEGTIVQINGCGFGMNPDDLSVMMVEPGGTSVPLTVLSNTDTQIFAKLGPVPFGALQGQIAVTKGVGQRGINTPALDDVIPENQQAVLVWDRRGNPQRAVAPGLFTPIPTAPPPGQSWLFGSRVPAGVMEMTVTGTWRPNTSLRVISKLHETVSKVGSDVEGTEIRLRCGGDAEYLARRIADAVQTAYATRGINTSATVTNAGVNTWKITLALLDATFVVVPIDVGAFTVVANEPSLVNPFAIGPVTGFYQAAMTIPGSGARVNNVDLTGEDGATISPNTPSTVGVLATTEPIVLDVTGESFTVRDWGTINGATANQLLGTGKLLRNGPALDVTANFAPISTGQVRVEVWFNTGFQGSMVVPNGAVASIVGSAGISGYGARPHQGLTEPFLWIDFDDAVTITPTGGLPAIGNQLRLIAVAPLDTVTNIQALDSSAGLTDPADVGFYVIFNSYEGGICYGNCDGTSVAPILTANDFQCFLDTFAAGSAKANCDGSTVAPTLTANDFQCFLDAFVAGCP